MTNENEDPFVTASCQGALCLGPKKWLYITFPFYIHAVGSLHHSSGADPLVHYGHHFGLTVHTMCSIHALIVMGLLHAAKIGDLELSPDEVLNDM